MNDKMGKILPIFPKALVSLIEYLKRESPSTQKENGLEV